MLVREHGDELTDDELVGVAGLLLLAGHETTSNMLGLGTLALLRHPEQLAAVRDDPDAVGPAVEELLRWLSIVQTAIPRITTTDVEIAGVTIPAGKLVFPSLPSGNRDPDFIDSPEILDIRRGAPGSSRVRARRAPLPRRAAGPDGDADRVPRAAAPVPESGAGRGLRRCAVPDVPLHLRAEVIGGELVKVQADRDVCIQAGNCVMVADTPFDQDDDGIVVVLVDDIPGDEEDKAREAVKLCPSQALTDRPRVTVLRRAIAARVRKDRVEKSQGRGVARAYREHAICYALVTRRARVGQPLQPD